jgi:hypothetical protein
MLSLQAGVAELADAPGLGPGGLRPLEVQVLSPALFLLRRITGPQERPSDRAKTPEGSLRSRVTAWKA